MKVVGIIDEQIISHCVDDECILEKRSFLNGECSSGRKYSHSDIMMDIIKYHDEKFKFVVAEVFNSRRQVGVENRIISAINWISVKNVDVLCLPFGVCSERKPVNLEVALRKLHDKGILVLSCVKHVGKKTYPSDFDFVRSVKDEGCGYEDDDCLMFSSRMPGVIKEKYNVIVGGACISLANYIGIKI